MGTDHSTPAARQETPKPTTSRSMVRAKAVKNLYHRDWTEIHTCSLSQWSRGHSAIFSFDHKIDYCVPHSHTGSNVVLQNIQPYCTRGYQFKIEKLDKDHTCIGVPPESCPRYKTPEIVTRRSWYVYPIHAPSVSIIGYHHNVAILQVVYKKIKELHFIAIELRTGKHLSVYKDIYISGPCIYEAYLSPDETVYLLRPNFFFAFSRCADPFGAFAITKDIKVISIKQYESKVIKIIEDISHLWHSIAFNPLSCHSSVALGNYTSDLSNHQVALFDLDEMKVSVLSDVFHSIVSHHLTFNPTGTLLVSLGIRLLWPRVDIIVPDKVLFFNPEDLSLVQVISRESVNINHFHASLTPLFSKTGEYMALIGSHGTSVSVYKMPSENSLKNLCRLNILQLVEDENIECLPLPQKLKNYLLFLPNSH